MASFLFATQPITGHVLPAIPIVRALAGRGHDVRWYVGKRFRTQAEEAGAELVPYQSAYDYDDADYDAAFPGRSERKAIAQLRFDNMNLFARQYEPQHRDLTAALRERPADVTVGDQSVLAPISVNELGGPPNALYNVGCLNLPGREVAPFGVGMLPSASPLGRLRNRVLHHVGPNFVFRSVSEEVARQCRLIGVAPRKFEVLSSRYLFLQATPESFEYRRSDLPPQVHFIGALLPDPPGDFVPPGGWGDVTERRRPVVLVSQETAATAAAADATGDTGDVAEVVGPTLRGMAGDDVLVVAAGVGDPAAVGPDGVPANARVEPFVPVGSLMPMVDAFVTDGGLGGVQLALSNGVPVVVCAKKQNPEVANRVTYSGCGIHVRTDRPAPEQVKEAVHRVLAEPTYREKARLIQAELAGKEAPTEAANLLERLAETRAPVLRSTRA